MGLSQIQGGEVKKTTLYKDVRKNTLPVIDKENRGFNFLLVAASRIIQIEKEQLIYSWESFVAEVGNPRILLLESLESLLTIPFVSEFLILRKVSISFVL